MSKRTRMNLLELLPSINGCIDKTVSSPMEKAQLQTKLKELDIRELEATTQSQSSWLSNGSFFVSGAIPSILWMMVLVICFNFIVSPILQGFFHVVIPSLDLPDWYSSMCTTIVLGLFAKKAYDSTDMTIGKFSKKSKYESETETENKSINAIINNNSKIIEATHEVKFTPDDIPEEIPSATEDNASDEDNIIEDIQREEELSKVDNTKPEAISKRFDELLNDLDA